MGTFKGKRKKSDSMQSPSILQTGGRCLKLFRILILLHKPLTELGLKRVCCLKGFTLCLSTHDRGCNFEFELLFREIISPLEYLI